MICFATNNSGFVVLCDPDVLRFISSISGLSVDWSCFAPFSYLLPVPRSPSFCFCSYFWCLGVDLVFFISEIGDGCLDRNGSFGSPVERFEFGKESVSRRFFFRSRDHLNQIPSFTIVCFAFVLEVIFLAPAKETMRLFPPSSCYWVHLPSNMCNIASNVRKFLFKWAMPHCCTCLV